MSNHDLSRLGLKVGDCPKAKSQPNALQHSANQILEMLGAGQSHVDLLRQGCELPALVSDTARHVKSLIGPINPNL